MEVCLQGEQGRALLAKGATWQRSEQSTSASFLMFSTPTPALSTVVPSGLGLVTGGRKRALQSHGLGSSSGLWQTAELLSVVICKMDIFTALASQDCVRLVGESLARSKC